MAAASAALQPFLDAQTGKDLLRFITCGSVDDGKSTLIGRLLWDSKLAFRDQLAALEEDSKRTGNAGEGEIDFALLVDGLSEERAQGITIDVAYRFFETEKRRFIVADTPGHEQYTRNMATGASTADLAVILIDARKGVLTQTRRHAGIVSLMGIRRVILAVNKMDLIGWEEAPFRRIAADFDAIAARLGFEVVTAIPVSALRGDQITRATGVCPWYDGPSLLAALEQAPAGHARTEAFRFPVQYVNRPNRDFRGYAGRVAAGRAAAGERVRVLPSGREAVLKEVIDGSGARSEAAEGRSLTLTLDRETDVSRGDVLVLAGDDTMHVADQFSAHIVWMHDEPLVPGRSYILRMGTAEAFASVTTIKFRRDPETFAETPAKTLGLNDIGQVEVSLSRPLAFDDYATCRDTGAFILIDRQTYATAAAGMVRCPLRRATNVHWHKLEIDSAHRARQKGQKAMCLWFTGLSGAGKSTIANLLDRQLNAQGFHTYILDGDNVRHGLNKDLGFTEADRVENIRRIAEVARLMVDAGLIVLVCAISPYRRDRLMARELFRPGDFLEVFVDTPLDICEQRDPKGLYKKARAGEIPNFTGISAPYERPDAAEIRIDSSRAAPEHLAEDVAAVLMRIERTHHGEPS